ncbi:hypothetical protein TNCV_5135511 [Trichonephila clavipes]|nr:hypothetical protein TNCV_5135511 [Trichonephila clavipes]
MIYHSFEREVKSEDKPRRRVCSDRITPRLFWNESRFTDQRRDVTLLRCNTVGNGRRTSEIRIKVKVTIKTNELVFTLLGGSTKDFNCRLLHQGGSYICVEAPRTSRSQEGYGPTGTRSRASSPSRLRLNEIMIGIILNIKCYFRT